MTTTTIEHKIAIIIRYHGPTNSTGSRISLTLPRWDNARKYVSWDYGQGTTSADQAEHWLAANGISPDTLLDMGGSYVLACKWEQRPAIFKAFGLPEAR